MQKLQDSYNRLEKTLPERLNSEILSDRLNQMAEKVGNPIRKNKEVKKAKRKATELSRKKNRKG